VAEDPRLRVLGGSLEGSLREAPLTGPVTAPPAPTTLEMPAHRVGVSVLGDDLTWLAQDVVEDAGDRYDVHDDLAPTTEIVVVGPTAESELADVCQTASPAEVLVVDWRTATDPNGIVACFDVGASGFVTTADPRVVIAHIDALARRTAPR